MTPERIEEIKRDAQAGRGHEDAFILNQEVLELLAALEEAQQEYELMKFDRDALVKLVANHHSAVDDACRELAEAQQTIARQREALKTSNESIIELLREQPNELWTTREIQSWLDIGNTALEVIAEFLDDEEGDEV